MKFPSERRHLEFILRLIETISKNFLKYNAKGLRLMKKFFAGVLALMIFLTANVALAAPISSDGYFNGIKLCGRVRVVRSFGDIKVQVVDSFPDLRVKKVSSFPDKIGEWQFVTSGEDFTVEFVDSFPDIKIKFVNSFPGL